MISRLGLGKLTHVKLIWQYVSKSPWIHLRKLSILHRKPCQDRGTRAGFSNGGKMREGYPDFLLSVWIALPSVKSSLALFLMWRVGLVVYIIVSEGTKSRKPKFKPHHGLVPQSQITIVRPIFWSIHLDTSLKQRHTYLCT